MVEDGLVSVTVVPRVGLASATSGAFSRNSCEERPLLAVQAFVSGRGGAVEEGSENEPAAYDDGDVALGVLFPLGLLLLLLGE